MIANVALLSNSSPKYILVISDSIEFVKKSLCQ